MTATTNRSPRGSLGHRILIFAAAGAIVLATLTGCSEDRDRTAGQAADAPPPPVAGRPLTDYDVIVIADDAGDVGDADLYGITLSPLQAFRITADKRISSMGADRTRVLVAAADQRVDKLGVVKADGSIAPIPGLGRPFAYEPIPLDARRIAYTDSGTNKDDRTRLLVFNAGTGERRVLYRDSPDFFGPVAGPGGEIAVVQYESPYTRNGEILIIDRGEVRSLKPARPSGNLVWGTRLMATSVEEDTADGDTVPAGLQLINPRTGKTRVIDGWDPIAWSPDGTRLLVRESADLTNSRLAILDPDDPEDLTMLGTIPQLTLYTGAWVRGQA
ncbi:MAG: hypothetical protein ACT4P1_17450 [Sporichthyaceae bacterium]